MNLPADIYSPDQLSALILELRRYAGVLHDASVRAKTRNGGMPKEPEVSELLGSFLKEAGSATDTPDSIEKLADELQTVLTKAPVAHLTFAALPGRALKQTFTQWFRTEIHPQTLLSFTARSDLGGGVVLQMGSHVYDFSFKRQILAHKDRISEIAGV